MNLCKFILSLMLLRMLTALPPVQAEDSTSISCHRQTVISPQANEIWRANCVHFCQHFFKSEDGEHTEIFARHCGEVHGPDWQTRIRNAGHFLELAFLRCVPKGGWKFVHGFVELYGSLTGAVAKLARGDGDWTLHQEGSVSNTEPWPNQQQVWASCLKDSVCKNSVGRNTLRFSETRPDGNWVVPDTQMEAELVKVDDNDLIQQLHHDRRALRDQCGETLAAIRRQVLSSGQDYGHGPQLEVFERLRRRSPQCPGVLDWSRPMSLTECVESSPDPLSCLGVGDVEFAFIACAGSEAAQGPTDRMAADVCSDVVQFGVGIPTLGSTTRLLFAGKAAPQAVEVVEGAREVESAGEEAANQASRSNDSQRQLERQFLDYAATSEAENLRFMDIVTHDSAAARENRLRVFTVENGPLKALNEGTGDKNLVTSLTNMFTDLVKKRVVQWQRAHPHLKVDVYSDFKAIKISIQSRAPLTEVEDTKIRDQLRDLYQEANGDFAAKMKSIPIDVQSAGPATNWLKAGYGATLADADAAARAARKGDNGFVDARAQSFVKSRSEQLVAAEQTRLEIASRSANQPLLEAEGGILLPRREVLDLVRKSEKKPEILAEALNKRFPGVSVQVDDARKFLQLAELADEFSPSILVASRKSINMSAARGGALSADFLGMGSANLRATILGIANKKDIHEAQTAAREGEKQVTAEFRRRMNQFKKVVGGEVICSGDDCVSARATTLSERLAIATKVASDPLTRNVRLSFVGAGVKEEERMKLASAGEAIEKQLRKELAGQMDPTTLEKLTFGLDMQTVELNRGTVNLLVGKASKMSFTTRDADALLAAFKRALEKCNGDAGHYTHGVGLTSESQLRFIPGAATINYWDRLDDQ